MNKALSLIILLIANVALAQRQGFTSEQIDSLVNKSMELMPQQVGIAVAVIEEGKVIHSKGYGHLSINSEEKVNEHTLFQIASNTKAFTAAALALLVDEGKIKWNDRVVQYIPEFTMYNDYVREHFTITDLLTHRSGLGLGAGDLMIFPPGSDFTMEDVLKNFQYHKPVSDFRAKFDYDNLLYLVAGEVVSRVSGQSYEAFVEEHILRPLGMDRSAVGLNRLKSRSNLAKPHRNDHGEIREIEGYMDGGELLAASGGIYSSVHDMGKWLLVQLNQGKYGDSLQYQLFKPERQREMWQPYSSLGFFPRPRPSFKYHFGAYGLGWFLSHVHDYSVIYHTGDLPGMLSHVILVPEINSAVVVLTNTSPGANSFNTITSAIRDEWIGRDRWDYLTNTKQQLARAEKWLDSKLQEVWKDAGVSNVKELKAQMYLGTYEDQWFGKISIENRNGKLWFQSLRSPQLNGEMFQYQPHTFAIKMAYTDIPCDALATFELDASGNPIGITMKGLSPNIDFSFDYQDLDLVRINE